MGYVQPTAYIHAARVGGDSAEMDATAVRVLGIVTAVAAPHSKTGDYVRALGIRAVYGPSRIRDLLVESTDRNALSIEYGHPWITPEGDYVRDIPGIRIFGRAFDIAKRL